MNEENNNNTTRRRHLFNLMPATTVSMHESDNDITRRKHGGNEASTDANLKVEKVIDRVAVIDVLKSLDGQSYSKQIANRLGKPLHTISGRLSELRADGTITRIKGTKIEGCEILRLNTEAK